MRSAVIRAECDSLENRHILFEKPFSDGLCERTKKTHLRHHLTDDIPTSRTSHLHLTGIFDNGMGGDRTESILNGADHIKYEIVVTQADAETRIFLYQLSGSES